MCAAAIVLRKRQKNTPDDGQLRPKHIVKGKKDKELQK
jgi:hypothetical protein